MTGAIGSEARTEGEPDAVARGWVEHGGRPRADALFVLAGDSLGIGHLDAPEQPWWVDLRSVTAADAIGDPSDGQEQVEIFLADGTAVRAAWATSFTGPLVEALRRVAGAPTSAAPATAPGPAPAPVAAAPPPAATPAVAGAPPVTTGAPPAAPGAPAAGPPAQGDGQAPSPDTATGGSALVLEDVVYLGGHPDHPKKRKKCVATLTREGLEVSGPHDVAFKVPWDQVRTVETQNSDEARFRMNTKIHRDATALVVECGAGLTILLEARDCPTIPLRSAIASLVSDLRVVVV